MQEQSERLNLPRTLKLGSFHIGSAFSDILTSAVWNRVLVSDLGLAAAPVALLSALRYFLAPLSIWAGNRSDTHPLFGKQRLPYIWIGRILMALALLLLPVATFQLATAPAAPLGWLCATLAFLIYGVGTLVSGSPFMALVRDNTPPTRRGQALSIVQIMLVLSFAITPGIYAALMKHYDPASFWRIVLVGVGLALPFWFFSVLGEDRIQPLSTSPGAVPSEPTMPFGALLRSMWNDRNARNFFIFLSLGAASAFAQDAILEPFGGDVFGMNVGETTLFNVYWGLGVLVGMLITTVLTRKRAPYEQEGTTRLGLMLTALPLLLLAMTALTENRALIIPTLALFGLGFGVYTVGAISLLMAMTSDRQAGAYLGLWSVSQLVFRGVGVALGGVLRDLVLAGTGSLTTAYATVFVLEAVGLLVCIALLSRIDVLAFAGRQRVALTPLAALAND